MLGQLAQDKAVQYSSASVTAYSLAIADAVGTYLELTLLGLGIVSMGLSIYISIQRIRRGKLNEDTDDKGD